jgi:uncharacterized protein YjbI with pentapeptide repeats
MSRLNGDEFLQRYARGERNFSNQRLSGNFSQADLQGADFSHADFSFVKLINANLSAASLENVNLNSAELTGANLYCSNLKGTRSTKVSFREANLENADLENTVLQGQQTDFTKANLRGANLRNANLQGANLTGAVLCGANLDGTNLTEANLQDADLTSTNLSNATFTGANWLETKLDNVDLLPAKEALAWCIINRSIENTNFQGTDLSDIKLDDANLQGMNFRGANLEAGRLTKANLSNANFSEANLHQSFLLQANLDNANIAGANLSASHLGRANLSNANLTNANLVNAKLRDANFSGANLDGADLRGAELFHANLEKALHVSRGILSLSIPLPSDNPNTELITAMRDVAQGLDFQSETTYPYEIFLWDVETKGNLRLDKLLKKLSYLQPISLDTVANSISASNLNQAKKFSELPQKLVESLEQLARAYRFLIAPLTPYLKTIEFYQFATRAMNDYSYIYPLIVLASTKSGDWLSITTGYDSGLFQEKSGSTTQNIAHTLSGDTETLIKTLENSLTDTNSLLPASAVSKHFIWKLATSKDVSLQNLLVSTNHFVVSRFKSIFQEDSREREYQKRKKLYDLVANNLKNIRLYRIGGAQMDFYLIGQAQNQDWVGVRTEVTWT